MTDSRLRASGTRQGSSKWRRGSNKEARYALGRVRAGDAFSREVRPPVWKAQLMLDAEKPKWEGRKCPQKPATQKRPYGSSDI